MQIENTISSIPARLKSWQRSQLEGDRNSDPLTSVATTPSSAASAGSLSLVPVEPSDSFSSAEYPRTPAPQSVPQLIINVREPSDAEDTEGEPDSKGAQVQQPLQAARVLSVSARFNDDR